MPTGRSHVTARSFLSVSSRVASTTLWRAAWHQPVPADEAAAPLLRSASHELEQPLPPLTTLLPPLPFPSPCLADLMRVKERPALLPRRLRAPLLALALAAAALFLFLPPRTSLSLSPCPRRLPRLISHRGFDADSSTYPSPASVRALIDGGVGSFDLDLFWLASPAPADSPLFIGHPPSTRALFALPSELVDTPLDQLRAGVRPSPSSPHSTIPLTQSIRLLAAPLCPTFPLDRIPLVASLGSHFCWDHLTGAQVPREARVELAPQVSLDQQDVCRVAA